MTERITTTCCITGGGPAGMMVGYLLARAGVDVLVLEKHQDFLRDFRGDTIHPSTLELMSELGLLDELLRIPHGRAESLAVTVGGQNFAVADFGGLATRCRYIVLMPQWDFLDLLARKAGQFPGFHLRMQTEVVELITADNRVTGVQARTPNGAVEVQADLVIGADGRSSTVRAEAGLRVRNLGAPMDVLWFRLPKADTDPRGIAGMVEPGAILVLIDRDTYWQCGYVIPKGGYDTLRQRGLLAFRQSIGKLAPFLVSRAEEIGSWEDVKLLTVSVDRLQRWWRPGLLCIGDSAHAMSPIGGVGINLAIQDAVAAANIVAAPLLRRAIADRDLARVQSRRSWPARGTQAIQLLAQRGIVARVLQGDRPFRLPIALQVIASERWMRRLLARLVGVGLRPEHARALLARGTALSDR